LMYWWSSLASLAPSVANALMQTPLLSDVVKTLAEMAPQRRAPVFAPATFRRWFAARAVRNVGARRVILWPDTWNDHFHPSTLEAAVEVLEDAGFRVMIPRRPLCCGRPLYDYGMLGLAKTLLWQVLSELRTEIRDGTPVIGLEPSCVSVFRDEMTNLLSGSEDAKRLQSQTFSLSEFLEKHASEYRLPSLNRQAIVQQHCHQKSVLDASAEASVLKKLGLQLEILDSGCCGMAGAFGFEAKHYDVSVAAGERVLLPKVRAADERTIVIADGFSCREQIAQLTDRQALHPVQVMKMALDDRGISRNDALPERRYMRDLAKDSAQSGMHGMVGLGILAALLLVGLIRSLSR
jgi:Fe-S oxidoreductase